MERGGAPMKVQYFHTREEWRQWLLEHFDKEREVWLTYPLVSSGERGILYNDAVEEALCFGWIDSTVKKLDGEHKIQRFTPRKPGSSYSQANKERLQRLIDRNRIHPSLMEEVKRVLSEPFLFPPDIMDAIEQAGALVNFEGFSDSYKRIRIAYIEGARKRPEEFKKRLGHFIRKTKEGKMIAGYGGIATYY